MFESAPEPVPQTVPARILPAQRLGALLEVLLCSGFPTQLFLIAVLTSLGMRSHDAQGALVPQFIFLLGLLDAVLVVLLIMFFLRVHGERSAEIFLGGRSIVREVLIGFLLVPIVFLVVILSLALVLTLAPGLHNVTHNPLEDMLRNPVDALSFGVVVMIAGGLREEIQRGFILHRFDDYLGGGGVGLVLYSAVFGLGHVEQGYDAAIATALLGAIWGVVYLTRRSIIAPMVSHTGFNLGQLLKYFIVR